MIVASGDTRVLFASKHMIALRIKRQVLARAHRPSHSMCFEHRNGRAKLMQGPGLKQVTGL